MIPLFRPSCSDLEIKYVTETLRSGYWSMGPRVAEFEARFAEFTGARHAIAVSSCTAALQLACEALGVAGGEVIVPALTFVSTGLAAVRAGARVVFADVDEETLCADWADVAAKTGPATRAVIPVWYGGTVAPVPPLTAVPVPVIEDCAHACGSKDAGRQGEIACWSFQARKNLATGDGGMITTDDDGIAAKVRAARWCGIDRSTWDREQASGYNWDYDVPRIGLKAEMNDLAASIGLAQLERFAELQEARMEITGRYLEELSGLGWLRLPAPDERSGWHLFACRVDVGDRDALVSHLLSQGVSAGVHYRPLNTYPVFGPRQELPVTDRVWKTLVTLPLYPDMTEAEQEQVIAAVRAFRPGAL